MSFAAVAKGFKSQNIPKWLLSVKQNMMNNSRVFCLRVPIPPHFRLYVISDPILCREILTDPRSDKPRAIYKKFRRAHKQRIGLFTANRTEPNESYVRSVRKSLLATMHQAQIQRMQKIADGIVDEWLDQDFQAKAEEQGTSSFIFDPAQEILWITFNVFLQAAFDYTPTLDEFKFYQENNEKIENGARLWNQFDIGFWIASRLGFSKTHNDSKEGAKNRRLFGQKIITEYRKSASTRSDDPTILHVLMNQPEILKLNDTETDAQLVCEVVTWLFAGHDTTGFSVAHALIFLAQHRECQEKLRMEVMKSKNEAANNRSTSYLSCVVRESWRLAPVAATGSARITGRAFTHEATGVVVPKGAVCSLPQLLYAHDAEIFPEPERFKPERWESPTPLMEKSYMPFSLGARNCPGQGLALGEIYSTIPKIIRKYRLELDTEGHIDCRLTYALLGYKLKATRLWGGMYLLVYNRGFSLFAAMYPGSIKLTT